MGGKKKKDDARGKAKLPRRIGGVKLSKGLRKAGGKLIEKAGTPLGRELIAAGLSMAAAAAATAAKKEREKHASAGRAEAPEIAPADDAAKPARRHGPADPHEIGVALGHIAQDVLGKIFSARPKT